MDDERWDATEEVEVLRKQKEKQKSQRWDEVDRVKEAAGSWDKVKHVEKSDQLFMFSEELCLLATFLKFDEQEFHLGRVGS